MPMLKCPVPSAPYIRSQSGKYISVPRAADMSPRSTIASAGQPNDSSSERTSLFAESSLPHTNTLCEPGTLAGSTITSQFIVLSAFTTHVSGSSRWTCSPRLSPLQIARVGGSPCEKFERIGDVHQHLALEVLGAGGAQRLDRGGAGGAVEDQQHHAASFRGSPAVTPRSRLRHGAGHDLGALRGQHEGLLRFRTGDRGVPGERVTDLDQLP